MTTDRAAQVQPSSDVAHAVEVGWRTRRRGIFEGLPRLGLRLAGHRYIGACVVGVVFHALAVAAFGLALQTLFLELSGRELVTYALVLASVFLAEGAVAAWHLVRLAAPIRAFLAGQGEGAARRASVAAARLPLAVLLRPDLLLLSGGGVLLSAFVLADVLALPASDSFLALPFLALLGLSSLILRYLGLELGMRPVLEAVGAEGAQDGPGVRSVSLHLRLVAAVPMVTWATGVIVAGLVTRDSRDLHRLGLVSVVSLAVAAVVSVWLSLVLADAVSGPVVDLRDATRRVAGGDLSVRVPVVSTDETGQLAASFNAMVAGLEERARFRDALGVLVDPSLAERVLAEGTDLHGDEIDASILFLDVREFTAFAEASSPRAVVTALNDLFELVVPVVLQHGGHANRFLGDGLLAVFGAPDRQPDHAERAVAAAQSIARLVREQPAGALRVGMGVHSGQLIVGTIGGGGRRDFTVIGDTVNTAARVEAATRETGDDLLITQATLDELPPHQQHRCEERHASDLKGKSTRIRLYSVRL